MRPRAGPGDGFRLLCGGLPHLSGTGGQNIIGLGKSQSRCDHGYNLCVKVVLVRLLGPVRRLC